MMGILSWLVTSRVGQAVGAAVGLLLGIWVIYTAGGRAERQEARIKFAEKRAKTAKQARKIEDDVNKADDADVRAGLDKWLRKK